ncbi:uncharacterized protein LOC120349856 [Nilaparvata lugens]|uniref:uncharacterized protein LOC120349856 n=1 Tax=Nilaparvata lugens TaxID=108931 RepID=UPI00193D40BC|nr:uncharacterized protein LOC120349856 [Nilaparvata lugens]
MVLPLILLLLAPATSYKMVDLSRTSGIAPIKIQNSHIINETFTYVHNINTSYLRLELSNIETFVDFLAKRNNIDKSRLSMMKLNLKYTKNKLNEIQSVNYRQKRGLFNGLGSAISWITGNMDADDKERYDKILQTVQSNEYHLSNNVDKQFAVNQKLINEFNNEMKVIRANNLKISNYFNSLFNESNRMEMNQQSSLLFDSLLLLNNKISDIVTSLEFCKLKILHSSIISHDDLFLLQKNSNVSFISNKISVLWKLSKVHCGIFKDHISYFVDVPLLSTVYETFFLLSYPVIVGNEILTTIAHPSFVLRNDKLFSGNCELIYDDYYCSEVSELNDKCIEQLLNDRNLDGCSKVVLKDGDSFIKYVEIVDSFILFNFSTCMVLNTDVNKNITLFLNKKTQLLKINSSETLIGYYKPNIFWENEIVLPTEFVEKKRLSNLNFDQVHIANINFQKLDVLDELPLTDNRNLCIILLLIFTVILLIVIIFLKRLFIWHKLCNLMCCKSEVENDTVQREPEQICPRLPCT